MLTVLMIVGLFQFDGVTGVLAIEADSQVSAQTDTGSPEELSEEEQENFEQDSDLQVESEKSEQPQQEAETNSALQSTIQSSEDRAVSAADNPFTGEIKGVRFSTYDWGEAVSFESGEPIYSTVSFAITSAKEVIEANRVMFRVALPKGSQVEITANKNYIVQKGDATEPQGTAEDTDKDYFWFTWKGTLGAATLDSFSFTATISANGTTPSGQTNKVEVEMYDCDSSTGLPIKVVASGTSGTITSIAPNFECQMYP